MIVTFDEHPGGRSMVATSPPHKRGDTPTSSLRPPRRFAAGVPTLIDRRRRWSANRYDVVIIGAGGAGMRAAVERVAGALPRC